jgi:hypothetical protein
MVIWARFKKEILEKLSSDHQTGHYNLILLCPQLLSVGFHFGLAAYQSKK